MFSFFPACPHSPYCFITHESLDLVASTLLLIIRLDLLFRLSLASSLPLPLPQLKPLVPSYNTCPTLPTWVNHDSLFKILQYFLLINTISTNFITRQPSFFTILHCATPFLATSSSSISHCVSAQHVFQCTSILFLQPKSPFLSL